MPPSSAMSVEPATGPQSLVPPRPDEPMIVAGMATMPGRRESAAMALRSILPQVHRLFLFLDRFEEPIDLPAPDIVAMRSQDFGELGSHGKFLGLLMCHRPTIYFGVDDDIIYPPDYVARMCRFLSLQSEPSMVGVHARFLRPGLKSYQRDHALAHFEFAMTRPRLADVLGCGTIAFDTRVLRFDPRGWAPPNMDDLHVAILCARRGLRRVMIPRPQFWLKAVQLQQADSIFKQMLRDDRAQTRLAQELLSIAGPASIIRPEDIKPR